MDKNEVEAYMAGLVLKGLLSQAPPEVQARVAEAAEKVRAIATEYGEDGLVALAVVQSELIGEFK